VADPLPPQPQPVLAAGWQRGCGLTVMVLGIALTMLSGLCTVGLTIADLSSTGGHGGEVNLTGIQYILGAPFIVVGALIWWGGWALSRTKPSASTPTPARAGDDDPIRPPSPPEH
jgi:hypothetical protein